jgi:hypothetical protein
LGVISLKFLSLKGLQVILLFLPVTVKTRKQPDGCLILKSKKGKFKKILSSSKFILLLSSLMT